MSFLRRGLKVACMLPRKIHGRGLNFFPRQGLRLPLRLQGKVEVIDGWGDSDPMQPVPTAHCPGRKVRQLQDSRERSLPVLPLPIQCPRLLGRSPQEGQVRLRVLGACVPHLPAIPTALSIRIPIAIKNEKLRANHFPGGGDDSTELARHF